MSSKSATDELAVLLKKHFGKKLDTTYLEGLARELVEALTNQQRRGEPSRTSLQLRFQEPPWLAREIRTLRERRKMTQIAVAKALRLSMSAYMRREAGGNKFRYLEVVALIELFGVTDPALAEKLKQAVE